MSLETLLEDLRAGDPDARDLLRGLGAELGAALPRLLEFLEPSRPKRLQLDALFVLEGLGSRAAPALSAVERLAAGKDPDLRAQAAETLAALGRAALPALERLVRHADADVRQAACRALGALGPEAAASAGALVERARRDGAQGVRERAIWALGRIGAEAALEPLAEILAEEGGAVGCWAAEALGRFGPRARPVARVLCEELHRDDAFLALSCAAALREIGAYVDTAVWALIALLQDAEDRDVRLEAAMLLGEFGPGARAAAPVLRAAADSGDGDLRRQARLALAKVRPEVAATLSES